MRATDKVIQKSQNTTKKIENRIYNYKMADKKKNSISRHKNLRPNMRKPLSRRIFSLKFGSYLKIVNTITLLK